MKLSKKLIIIILLLSSFIVFGCEKNQTRIEIDENTLHEKYDVYSFKLNSINLKVYEDDQLIETIPLKESMISPEDLSKLEDVGVHTIKVSYAGKTINLKINLVDSVFVYFYADNKLVDRVDLLSGDSLNNLPNVPEKMGYIGYWDIEVGTVINQDVRVDCIYINSPDLLIEEVVNKLDNEFTDIFVNQDLKLEKYIGNCTLDWESDSVYLTNDGTFIRPYEETKAQIKVNITDGQTTVSKEYHVTLEGYKNLTKGIGAGYVYTNYFGLTDNFFETIDIIYAAFIMVDTDGDFVGKDTSNTSVLNNNLSVLAKIKNNVIPKARKEGSYVIASLAGGGSVMADTMSVIAASATLRKTFASNIVNLINEYNLDGIDIDWETPSYSERTNFTLLMKEIYTQVKNNNPHHLVTAAIGGGGWQPQLYDLNNSDDYLDYINIMSYSMSSSGGYYQSALYSTSSYYNSTYKVGRNSTSVDSSIDTYNSLGVTNDKLIIGAAFYGMSQLKNGSSWRRGGTVEYSEIKRYIESGLYYYFYDDRAQVPFLLKKDGKEFISYDDGRSIKAKCQYVFDHHLAGVMYWENGNDSTGDLVMAIYEGLKKGQ